MKPHQTKGAWITTAVYLLAYVPPSNIAQDILVIKRFLFQNFGAPSAIALPPLVPLRILEDKPGRQHIEQTYPLHGRKFFTKGYTVSKMSLFLQIDFGGPIEVGTHDFFPLYAGFHIMEKEKNSPPLEKILSELPAPAEPTWTTGKLSLYAIDLEHDSRTWWLSIRFEEVYQVKVKKGRKREG